MRRLALGVALMVFVAACSDSASTTTAAPATDAIAPVATTTTETPTTTTTAPTSTTAAPTPIMEGWHRVSATDGELGSGGGGGLRAVIEGGPGLMAFGKACRLEGGSSVDCYLGVWGSVDGTQWQQLANLGSAEFWTVATLGTLVVIGGSSCSMREQERGDECGPALWTSTDGIEWSITSSDDQVFVPCDEDDVSSCRARVEGIVELPSGGLLAYGFSALGSTTWTSRDGLAWELGQVSFTPFGQYRGGYRWLEQVLVGGEGLVAVGSWSTGGPTLGVGVEDYGVGEGVIVESVESNGGSAAAGIHEGDIIVALDGEQVTDFPTLTLLLYNHGVGDTVAIVVVRQDGEVELDVVLGGSEEWFFAMLMATSTNGEEWTQLEPPLVSDGDAYFNSRVTEWSGGLATLAEVCDRGYNCQQLLLTSRDGISWQTHRFGDASSDITLFKVYGFGSGLLVGGRVYNEETGEDQGALGVSPDGDTWTLYQTDPDVIPGDYVPFSDIIEFEDLTLAVGATGGGPAVWWYSG